MSEKFLGIFGLADPNYQPIDVHSVLASGYTVDLVIAASELLENTKAKIIERKKFLDNFILKEFK